MSPTEMPMGHAVSMTARAVRISCSMNQSVTILVRMTLKIEPPMPVISRPTYKASVPCALAMISAPMIMASAPIMSRFLSRTARVSAPLGMEMKIPGSRKKPISVPTCV